MAGTMAIPIAPQRMNPPPADRPPEFDALVLEHLEMLFAVALKLTRNVLDAQDLTQTTLLKAMRFHQRFEKGTYIKAWLLTILRNTGTNIAPSFRQEPAMKLVDAYHLAPALGDLDGDGDLDLLVGTWNQDVKYFRNDGTSKDAKWVAQPALDIKPPRASLSSPVLADVDGDKDLDVFIGTATGAVLFYRNDGSPKAARWTLVSEKFSDIAAGRRSRPAFVDVDGDGVLDLLMGKEEGGVTLYRNRGTRTAARFAEDPGFALPLPPLSTPIGVDLDGDGKIEIVSGGVSGGLTYWK